MPPPRQASTNTQHQQARPSMGSGIMGGLMSGMAFGAGAEMIRGLFRGGQGHEGEGGEGGYESFGKSVILPLLLSGAIAYGAHKKLFVPSKYRPFYTTAVFGGSFLVTNQMF
jgi:hypothetical protein